MRPLLSAFAASLWAWTLCWLAQLGLGLGTLGGDLRAGTWLLERSVAGLMLGPRLHSDPTLVAILHLAYVPDAGDRPPLLLGWGALGVLSGALLTGALLALVERIPRLRDRSDGLHRVLLLGIPLGLAAGRAGQVAGFGAVEVLLGVLAAALATALTGTRWGLGLSAPLGLGLALLASPWLREGPEASNPTPISASLLSVSGLPAPKRVILITVDTLRADHLGAWGYGRDTSPNLDRMAREEGVIFTQAYSSAPWTLPSVTATFTSMPPPVHTVEDQNRSLGATPTLAEGFTEAGWLSAAFVTHIYVTSLFGLDRGFGEFHELSIDWGFAEGHQLRAEALNAEVFPWLAQHADQPFFLYLHYFDPHWDYDAPEPWGSQFTDPSYAGPAQGTWQFISQYLPLDRPMPPAELQHIIDLYDGEIRYTDHHLGLLFEELRRLGLWDDTLLVISADHGEEFKEHGSLHHIRTLYEEMLHVPQLWKLPKGRPEAWPAQVQTRVRNLDIAPTLLHLAGLPVPSSFEGESLLPLMRGEPSGEPGRDRVVVARSLRHRVDVVGLLDGPWKYIRRYAPGFVSEELYRLDQDPLEQHNLAEQEAAMLLERRQNLERWLIDARGRRVSTRAEDVQVELGDEQLKQLEALGYVEE